MAEISANSLKELTQKSFSAIYTKGNLFDGIENIYLDAVDSEEEDHKYSHSMEPIPSGAYNSDYSVVEPATFQISGVLVDRKIGSNQIQSAIRKISNYTSTASSLVPCQQTGYIKNLVDKAQSTASVATSYVNTAINLANGAKSVYNSVFGSDKTESTTHSFDMKKKLVGFANQMPIVDLNINGEIIKNVKITDLQIRRDIGKETGRYFVDITCTKIDIIEVNALGLVVKNNNFKLQRASKVSMGADQGTQTTRRKSLLRSILDFFN